jgi:hypothetical protein
MMNLKEAWARFVKTGKISDYLDYKKIEKKDK